MVTPLSHPAELAIPTTQPVQSQLPASTLDKDPLELFCETTPRHHINKLGYSRLLEVTFCVARLKVEARKARQRAATQEHVYELHEASPLNDVTDSTNYVTPPPNYWALNHQVDPDTTDDSLEEERYDDSDTDESGSESESEEAEEEEGGERDPVAAILPIDPTKIPTNRAELAANKVKLLQFVHDAVSSLNVFPPSTHFLFELSASN